MAARDQVKTMVPEAHSTLDGHPKKQQRKATQFFSCFWLTRSHKPHTSWLMTGVATRPSKISPVRHLEAYLLEYIWL